MQEYWADMNKFGENCLLGSCSMWVRGKYSPYTHFWKEKWHHFIKKWLEILEFIVLESLISNFQWQYVEHVFSLLFQRVLIAN